MNVMRCAICYHLYNLKNVKNTHGGVLLLVKLQALLKVTLLHGSFSRFLNCTNGTKSHKTSQTCHLIAFTTSTQHITIQNYPDFSAFNIQLFRVFFSERTVKSATHTLTSSPHFHIPIFLRFY